MRGNIKKTAGMLLSCAGFAVSAGAPAGYAAAPAVDYELVGLWRSADTNEYAEFCADGMVYGMTETTMNGGGPEVYYQYKNSPEGTEIIFEYTANGEVIEILGLQASYKITGDTMFVQMVEHQGTLEKVFDFGDVDNDGEINALDASEVLTEYAASATGGALELDFIQTKAADVNCDGAVDALDASEILGYYAYKATGGSGCFAEYYYG